ncbi:MAG: cytochrome c [Candidatus Latescibacterota bacterium]
MSAKGTRGLAVVALLAAAALAADLNLKGTSAEGRRLFHSPAVGTNGLSCAHCHADFDESRRDDGLIRSGHSLWNAALRETWWGQNPREPGAYANIAAAAVVCVEHYMQNPNKLTAQEMLDLQAYLTAITVRPVRLALALAPGADATGEYAGFEGGNPFQGKEAFYAACHVCHPNGNAGIAPAIPRHRLPAFYAAKVREGDGLGAVLAGVDPNAYDPSGGQHMPFFGVDRLSDDQLRDIIAYLTVPPAP